MLLRRGVQNPQGSVDERRLMKEFKVYVSGGRSRGELSLFSGGTNYGIFNLKANMRSRRCGWHYWSLSSGREMPNRSDIHKTWPLPQSQQLGEGNRVTEIPQPLFYISVSTLIDNKMASGSEFCSLWMSAYWGIEQGRKQWRIDSERTQRI